MRSPASPPEPHTKDAGIACKADIFPYERSLYGNTLCASLGPRRLERVVARRKDRPGRGSISLSVNRVTKPVEDGGASDISLVRCGQSNGLCNAVVAPHAHEDIPVGDHQRSCGQVRNLAGGVAETTRQNHSSLRTRSSGLMLFRSPVVPIVKLTGVAGATSGVDAR